jgi:hypothetical protein
MRQHYGAALVESEDQAQRLLSLGVGAAAAVLLMTAPALGPVLYPVWMVLCAGLGVVAFAARGRMYEHVRQMILEQLLRTQAPLDTELWERVAKLGHLPTPIDQYVEHFLSTYLELKRHVRDGDKVELGQVQLIQAREHVFEFLDLAERTGRIRNVLDTMSHRLSDDDQIRLRQRFSEQCTGLQQITQSFDRSLGNLVMAQVLGDELGESTIETVGERMRVIEDELEEVKLSLAGEQP